MRRRSRSGDTVSRGTWSQAYHVTERSFGEDIGILERGDGRRSKPEEEARSQQVASEPPRRRLRGSKRRDQLEFHVPLQGPRHDAPVFGRRCESLKRRVVDIWHHTDRI